MERPDIGRRKDLKEELAHLYAPDADAITLVEVPELSFILIDGSGEPGQSKDFRSAIKTLRYVSFALIFNLRERRPDLSYAVMPLETLFAGTPAGALSIGEPDGWQWRSMVAMPDVVTIEFVKETLIEVEQAKKAKDVDKVRFERVAEGHAVQLLHEGPFTDEGHSIRRLHDYIAQHGLTVSGAHHEIYLTDPERVLPHRRRTILRQPVRIDTEGTDG